MLRDWELCPCWFLWVFFPLAAVSPGTGMCWLKTCPLSTTWFWWTPLKWLNKRFYFSLWRSNYFPRHSIMLSWQKSDSQMSFHYCCKIKEGTTLYIKMSLHSTFCFYWRDTSPQVKTSPLGPEWKMREGEKELQSLLRLWASTAS